MSPMMRRIILGSVAVLLIGGFAAWWFSGFSLDFMQFFAAETDDSVPSTDGNVDVTVDGDDSGETQFDTPPLSLVSCAPETQTVSVNQAATLTAASGTGPYQWFAPDGVIEGGGTEDQGIVGEQITVTYAMPGTKKVTIQADRDDGSGTDSVVCTVVVTPLLSNDGQ